MAVIKMTPEEQLRPGNWEDWYNLFQALCLQRDLWDVFTGADFAPASSLVNKAKGSLLACISSPYHHAVNEIFLANKTPKDALDHLKSLATSNQKARPPPVPPPGPGEPQAEPQGGHRPVLQPRHEVDVQPQDRRGNDRHGPHLREDPGRPPAALRELRPVAPAREALRRGAARDHPVRGAAHQGLRTRRPPVPP